MTNTLIVLAHPGPGSFTHAWAEASARAAGPVRMLDLYAMGFEAAERGAFYGIDGGFDPLRAQEDAAQAGHLPKEIAAQVEAILWADQVVFHFPLWWFAPPAILKGWLDRVLVHGALHSVDRRFDAGVCRGKRALFCVSTGSNAVESGQGGKEGDLRLLLWPLAYTLRYCGFDIATPVAVHGVHGYHKGAAEAELEARLRDVLAGQAQLIAGLGARTLWRFNADSEFDEAGRLRVDAPVYSPFIDPVGF